ncbi:Tubby c-terminal-like domain [Globisporangium polare]
MGNQNSAPPQGHVALVLGESLVVQPLPTAAVDVQYCSLTPVQLEVTSDSVSRSRFIVREPTTHVVYFYKETKTFSSRATLVDVRDADNRVRVLNIKMVSFSSKHRVRLGDTDAYPELVQMQAGVGLDTADLQVSFADLTTGERCFMGVEGNWRLHQAFLWLGRGRDASSVEREPVARVWAPGGNASASNDVYTLTIAPNVDIALIIAICMVLDTQWRVYKSNRDA